MKQLYFILMLLFFASCDKSENYDDLLPYRTVDYIVNMALPQYSDLLIPGQSKETPENIGVKGILIYNFNGSYKAFDLACPHLDPTTCAKMTFDGSLFLECPCDDARFSIYDGSPQTDGINYRAREYHIVRLNNTQLRITN